MADRHGARVLAEAVEVDRDLVRLRVVERLDESEPSLRLTLVQALSKDGRDEDAVEAATELGVDGIVPWQADRSIVRWKGPKVDKGLRKWANVIERAAKQSRRGRWPRLDELVTSQGLAERFAGATPSSCTRTPRRRWPPSTCPTKGRSSSSSDRRAGSRRRSWSASWLSGVSRSASAPRCCGPRRPGLRPSRCSAPEVAGGRGVLPMSWGRDGL